jgi:formylglycine-generating enzyme required for sulfatase activity
LRRQGISSRAFIALHSACFVVGLSSCTEHNPAYRIEVNDSAAPPRAELGGGSSKHEDPSGPPAQGEGTPPAPDATLAPGDAGVSAQPSAGEPDAAGEVVVSSPCGGATPVGWSCIPPGSFTMGSPTGERDRESQEVQHLVTLTRAFWMSQTEVTQRAWRALMAKDPSSHASCGLDCPVERMTWYETLAYANAASVHDGLSPCYFTDAGSVYDAAAALARQAAKWPEGPGCAGYRLPTEAEWEFAARAGSPSPFPDGGSSMGKACTPVLAPLDAVGWYCGNANDLPQPVARRGANAWGLHDVHGNVWEWVWDTGGSYPNGPVTDPLGPASGSERISRGGAYHNGPHHCRAAVRASDPATAVYPDTGFRLVRTAL